MAWAALEDDFWRDPDLADWPPSARLLYAYLLSGPACDYVTGIYRLPAVQEIAAHTGMRRGTIEKYTAFLRKRQKIRLKLGWVWVVGKGNHSLVSPKLAAGVPRRLREAPIELARGFVEKYDEILSGYGLNGRLTRYRTDRVSDRVSIPLRQTDPNPNPDPEETCTPIPDPMGGVRGGQMDQGSGSQNLSDRGSETVGGPDAFAVAITEILKLSVDGPGGKRQYVRDLGWLRGFGGRIFAGEYGEPRGVVIRCIAKAEEIASDAADRRRTGADRQIRRPARIFVAWVRDNFEERNGR